MTFYSITILLATAIPKGIGSTQTLLSITNSPYLENYTLSPTLGNCYQFYDTIELPFGCRREPDLKNQACVKWIQDEEQCLGLSTPTNETILLKCKSKTESGKCFDVEGLVGNTTICQQVFDNHKVGITTPDNFTLVFHNDFCKTTVNNTEREIYKSFYENFVLDADSKRCYKVYNAKQSVTPYNYINDSIQEICLSTVRGDCSGLVTQTNEILVLDCPDKKKLPLENNCFHLYTSENKEHKVCQKRVEERCIGVVTPSNLNVLLDGFYCSQADGQTFHYYNQTRRKYKQFVETFLSNLYLGKDIDLLNLTYMLYYKDKRSKDRCPTILPYWMKDTTCFGFQLDSKEIVNLKCFNQEDVEPGCFQLISGDGKYSKICAKLLNEACVGLTTLENQSVTLACHPEYDRCVKDLNPNKKRHRQKGEIKRRQWFFQQLSRFTNHLPSYAVGNSFYLTIRKMNESGHLTVKQNTVKIEELYDEQNCSGILTDTEKIVLHCPEITPNGCYNDQKTDCNKN